VQEVLRETPFWSRIQADIWFFEAFRCHAVTPGGELS